jgi:hypothetical protein
LAYKRKNDGLIAPRPVSYAKFADYVGDPLRIEITAIDDVEIDRETGAIALVCVARDGLRYAMKLTGSAAAILADAVSRS